MQTWSIHAILCFKNQIQLSLQWMNYIHKVEYHLAFGRDKRWARWLSRYKCLCASLWAWVPSLEPTNRWEDRTSSIQLSPDGHVHTMVHMSSSHNNNHQNWKIKWKGSQELWYTPLIMALGKLRHKVCEFEASTGHVVNPSPPKTVCQGLFQKSKGCMYEILWDARI